MRVGQQHYRTIWHCSNESGAPIKIIDQRCLPHHFQIESIFTVQEMFLAIQEMHLRGAGLIGAAGAYGVYLAVREALGAPDFDPSFHGAITHLKSSRPTAINLFWAIDRVCQEIASIPPGPAKLAAALNSAQTIADEDAAACAAIGQHGLKLIQAIAAQKGPGKPVNILTHCNAGWLAFVDHGTATAPIYAAAQSGLPVHVWVDETRPRNQGAMLTAWELGEQGIAHTLIADNCGGHLMQHGQVDLVIVGSDRTTYTGDVANKIGTYLKALAAFDNKIPFYVALPSSTIDWQMRDGVKEIPIERRGDDEVKWMRGVQSNGEWGEVLITPMSTPAANYGFDVTPARLITGLITERGLCAANEAAITALFQHS